MAKIHDLFLRNILTTDELDEDECTLTESLQEMGKYASYSLELDPQDYSNYFVASYKDILESDIDTDGAALLRQQGWKLDADGERVIKRL